MSARIRELVRQLPDLRTLEPRLEARATERPAATPAQLRAEYQQLVSYFTDLARPGEGVLPTHQERQERAARLLELTDELAMTQASEFAGSAREALHELSSTLGYEFLAPEAAQLLTALDARDDLSRALVEGFLAPDEHAALADFLQTLGVAEAALRADVTDCFTGAGQGVAVDELLREVPGGFEGLALPQLLERAAARALVEAPSRQAEAFAQNARDAAEKLRQGAVPGTFRDRGNVVVVAKLVPEGLQLPWASGLVTTLHELGDLARGL